MIVGRLIAAAGALAMVGFAPARGAPSDDFAAACAQSGQRPPASCKCQAKLARGLLDAAEMRVAIDNMDGNSEAMRAALIAMGEAKSKAFIGKLQTLQARAASACK